MPTSARPYECPPYSTMQLYEDRWYNVVLQMPQGKKQIVDFKDTIRHPNTLVIFGNRLLPDFYTEWSRPICHNAMSFFRDFCNNIYDKRNTYILNTTPYVLETIKELLGKYQIDTIHATPYTNDFDEQDFWNIYNRTREIKDTVANDNIEQAVILMLLEVTSNQKWAYQYFTDYNGLSTVCYYLHAHYGMSIDPVGHIYSHWLESYQRWIYLSENYKLSQITDHDFFLNKFYTVNPCDPDLRAIEDNKVFNIPFVKSEDIKNFIAEQVGCVPDKLILMRFQEYLPLFKMVE